MYKWMKWWTWIIDRLFYPINEALRQASEMAGKCNGMESEKGWYKKLPWYVRVRFRIWIWGELGHWWRWKGFFRQKRHEFIMWLHKHNLLCRCVSHYQRTGKHSSNCPKSKKRFWRSMK